MPWLKTSDAAAWHPLLLEVLEFSVEEPWLINEVFGFLNRCAVQSAQFELDYVVTYGVALQTANGVDRFQVLDRVCQTVGLWSPIELPSEDGGPTRRGFKLVEEKDLWHMILKSERAWETQRRKDVGNTAWTVEVRRRDGDACRWCGNVVGWGGDKKSGRSGTYDHRVPGQGATGPADLYVACRPCNSARSDEKNREWNRTLLPIPEKPYYHRTTVAWLAKHGVQVEATDHRRPTRPARPAGAAGSTTPAAEQAPQRDTASAPSSTAPVAPAAGSTASATAAAPSAQRDTAGQERQREAAARDAGRPDATAAAATARRGEEERRRDAEAEHLARIDEWMAGRGAQEALSPLDAEEIEWTPEPPVEAAQEPPSGPSWDTVTIGRPRDLQIPADPQAEGSGFPGTGRDGSGREGLGLVGHGQGSGWDGSGLDGSAGGSGGAGKGSGRRRKRGRRGGRGRGGSSEG